MGGPIAQLLWRRHRDVVAGLVLCATSCTFGGTPRETILFRVADGTAAIVGHVPLAPLTKAAVGAVGRWRALRGKPWWGFAEVARHDWAQVVEAGRELGRFDSRPWIDEVDVPTAIVVTDLDDVVPVHRQLDLSRRLADASVHRVAGGHAVCTLDPGGFLPALLDCLPLRHAAATPRCRVTDTRHPAPQRRQGNVASGTAYSIGARPESAKPATSSVATIAVAGSSVRTAVADRL